VSDDLVVGAAPAPDSTARPAVAERLGGQALYVLVGNVFTLLVGLPLQVYVSRRLGSGGLGTFSLLEGVAGTIAGFLGLGLASTAVRYIPQFLEEGDVASIKHLILRGALVLSALGAAGYVVFLVFCFGVPSTATLRSTPVAVFFMGAMIPLGLLTYFAQQSLRGFQEIRYLIAGSSFLQLTVKASATIALFFLGARLSGYAFATSLAALAALIWMTIGLLRKLRSLRHLAQRKQSNDPWKRYAAISFATSLVSLPSAYLDRFLLAVFASTGAVGVLVVARQLQQLPAVLYQMLLSVAAPMFSGAHARGAREEQAHLYALITDWAVKAALPLVVFLTLFARPVLSLFGQQFAEVGTLPLQIMMAAQLFNLASGPNGNVAIMCGLEREALRVDIVMLLATAVLFVVLVPLYGLVGVALSVLVNAILHNLWTLQIVRTRLQIRWWDRRYLSWVAPATTVGVIGLLAARTIETWSVPALVFALAVIYGAFAVVILLQGLHSDDRDLIAHVRRQLAFK
jgi:O-antigen/teichoic acid export membrane protein